MNKAIIVGRMGSDPEVRYTQGGQAIANFNVATTERYTDKAGQRQEKTEWHRCVLWGKTAEFAGQYCKKGDLVLVEGPSRTREWEKDGIKRYVTEVHGNISFEKLTWSEGDKDRKPVGAGGGQGGGSTAGGYNDFAPGGGVNAGKASEEDDSDFPF
jgi:single-strand DNA-binding protein